jgi:patatin-like phospholipase/acyl hydrolase
MAANSKFRILSLDGGGIRGVLTTTILDRLEAANPGFLASVDLIAGTSTGGILALGLAAGKSPGTMRKLYEDNGTKIFAQDLIEKLIHIEIDQLVKASYSNTALKSALIEVFNQLTLDGLNKKILIASFDLDNLASGAGKIRSWKPKFFHNFPGTGSDGAEVVVDVALRTSAAPTYFPIYQGFIDGGVVANNPSMCALAQAIHELNKSQTAAQITLLSLGTGRSLDYLADQNSSWGLAQWAPHLVSIMLGGSEGVADYQCSQVLGNAYYRVDPVMEVGVGLDAYQQIPYLKQIGSQVDLTGVNDWIKTTYMN